MEVAFVRLGLLPDVFWDMTWREFDYAVRHHEMQAEFKWDIARTLGSWSIAPHTKKKIKPSDLFKLPSEVKGRKGGKVPTREEFEAHIKALEHGRPN